MAEHAIQKTGTDKTTKIAKHAMYALTTLTVSRLALLLPIQNFKTRVQLCEVSDIDLARSMIVHKDDDDENDSKSSPESVWSYSAMKENLAVQIGDSIVSMVAKRVFKNVTPVVPEIISLAITYPLHLRYLRKVAEMGTSDNRRAKNKSNETTGQELTKKDWFLNRSLPLALLHRAAVSSVAIYVFQPAIRDFFVKNDIISESDENLLNVFTNTLSYLVSKMIFTPLEIVYKRKGVDEIQKIRYQRSIVVPELIKTSIKSVLLAIPEEALNIVQFAIYRTLARTF